MQEYSLTEAQLDAALNDAQVINNIAYVFLPRLTLGEELPAVWFNAGTSVEEARDAIITNILPKIRAGELGVPAKPPAHQASLTVH